jgi:hypothetical protein
MSVVLLTGLFNQLVFTKNHAWVALSPDLVVQTRASARIYVAMTLFAIVYTVYLAVGPSLAAEMGGGIIAFLVALFTLIRQHLEMVAEKHRMGIA